MEEHQDNHEDQKNNKQEIEEEVKSQPTKINYKNNKHEKSGDSYEGFLDEFDDEDDDYSYSERLIENLGFKKRKFGFTCSYCDKDFPTTKSLFRHMRCHSDTPHTEEVEEEETGIINQENGISVVDLALGLGGLRWFKKGIRGNSSSAMEDKSGSTGNNNGIYEYNSDASNLLLNLYKGGGSESNLEDEEAATTLTSEGTGVFLDYAMSKKTTKRSGEQFCNEESKAAGVMNLLKNKGQSKTILENDKAVLDAADNHVISQHSEAAPPPRPPSQPLGGNCKVFRCSSCGKIFATHQALGGHRASHNKFRMSIHNTIDDEVLPPDHLRSMKDKFSSKGRRICKIEKNKAATTEEVVRKVLDFDLNQLPEEEN